MKLIRCPRCGRETPYEGNEHRPFCSDRCKLIDFGAWADEEYSLPAEGSATTEDDLAELEDALRKKQEN